MQENDDKQPDNLVVTSRLIYGTVHNHPNPKRDYSHEERKEDNQKEWGKD